MKWLLQASMDEWCCWWSIWNGWVCNVAEQRDLKMKKRKLQQQRRQEDRMVAAATMWNKEILPNWETMSVTHSVIYFGRILLEQTPLWWNSVEDEVILMSSLHTFPVGLFPLYQVLLRRSDFVVITAHLPCGFVPSVPSSVKTKWFWCPHCTPSL